MEMNLLEPFLELLKIRNDGVDFKYNIFGSITIDMFSCRFIRPECPRLENFFRIFPLIFGKL